MQKKKTYGWEPILLLKIASVTRKLDVYVCCICCVTVLFYSAHDFTFPQQRGAELRPGIIDRACRKTTVGYRFIQGLQLIPSEHHGQTTNTGEATHKNVSHNSSNLH